MFKRFVLFSLVSFFLVACSLPKSSTDLINSSKRVGTFCYDEPVNIVNQRVNNYMQMCNSKDIESATYVSGIIIPLRIKQDIVKESLPYGTRYSVKGPQAVTLTAEVIPNVQGCNTFIKTYAFAGFWDRHFTPLDNAVEGRPILCPK